MDESLVNNTCKHEKYLFFLPPNEMYFAKFRSLLNHWLLCTSEEHNLNLCLQVLHIFSNFSANPCSFGLVILIVV
jgi:hypothetical protein